MRYLRAICRFTVGIIFILSGFLKAVDPIGNSLKIDEYLKAFHLGFLDFISMPFAVLLACMEFLIGVCVLKGIKMRFFSTAALSFARAFSINVGDAFKTKKEKLAWISKIDQPKGKKPAALTRNDINKLWLINDHLSNFVES